MALTVGGAVYLFLPLFFLFLTLLPFIFPHYRLLRAILLSQFIPSTIILISHTHISSSLPIYLTSTRPGSKDHAQTIPRSPETPRPSRLLPPPHRPLCLHPRLPYFPPNLHSLPLAHHRRLHRTLGLHPPETGLPLPGLLGHLSTQGSDKRPGLVIRYVQEARTIYSTSQDSVHDRFTCC